MPTYTIISLNVPPNAGALRETQPPSIAELLVNELGRVSRHARVVAVIPTRITSTLPFDHRSYDVTHIDVVLEDA